MNITRIIQRSFAENAASLAARKSYSNDISDSTFIYIIVFGGGALVILNMIAFYCLILEFSKKKQKSGFKLPAFDEYREKYTN
jgi:hypothetical protein